VSTGLLRTPRPMPGRLVPIVSGGAIFALALPIYLLADWRLAGWGLAAALWVAGELFGLLLGRLRFGMGNLAASGVVAFGMMFRAVAVMVVVIAVAVSDARLALSAAVLYALSYTFELGVWIASYFSGPAR